MIIRRERKRSLLLYLRYNENMELNRLIAISDNIRSMTGIRSYIISKDGDILYEPEDTDRWDILVRDKNEIISNLTDYFSRKKRPAVTIIQTEVYEFFTAVQIRSEERFEGLIFIGPIMPGDISDSDLHAALYRYGIAVSQEEYIHFFRNLPVYSFEEMTGFASFFHISLYGTIPDRNEILNTFYTMHDGIHTESVREKKRIYHKIETSPEYTMEYENALLEAIAAGNSQAIDSIFENIAKNDRSELAPHDSLRSLKNKAISVITLATRSAVKGGLDLETAFSASDHYIVFVESYTMADQIVRAMVSICREFAQKVGEVQLSSYSPAVTKAIQYIQNHTYDQISVDDVCEKMQYSSGYLEAKFRKETGRSIHQWISSSRLNEAQRILKYTDYTLPEISVMLGYTDQSHFSKRFKAELGVSPAKYRKMHKG